MKNDLLIFSRYLRSMKDWSTQDKRLMSRALQLARKGLGHTRPNPAVGAVVVRDGVIVGEGYHERAGTPHAEIHALLAAGDKARGADIYVTLEPCNHTGRTPPCTRAILEHGIKRVVIGTSDPNPKVAGGGGRFLADHGIIVETGCKEQECRLLIAPFAKHMVKGLPWVRSKVACSLDGKIATRTGHSKWITNEKARRFGHRLREISDAILVGRGTVAADNPRLTCRMLPSRASRERANADPARVILDSHFQMDPASLVCQPGSSAPTIVAGVDGPASRIDALRRSGCEIWRVPAGRDGRVDLEALLRLFGKSGFQSILVEGGATLHGAFWERRLVDEAFFFFAPLVIGGTKALGAIGGPGVEKVHDAPRLHGITHRRLGDNWLVTGIVSDPGALWR